mmetsp:Transcript_25534/g.53210  ORF Transcript_25534/g.53210 Transcript_25534/m.53210 type:complete len:232 (+) Transcript_25534:365-1060(+)
MQRASRAFCSRLQFRLGPRLESIPVVAIPARILVQVLLVFLVGLVERRVVHDRRFDRLALVAGDGLVVQVGLQFLLDALGDFPLVSGGHKDGAPVLRPAVVPLPVEGGGVVKGVKEFHQLLEQFRCGRGVLRQLDVQHLDVAGGSAADLAIRGVLHSVGIGVHEANPGLGDAARVQLLEILDDVFFRSPVAACAECQCRCYRCHVAVVVCVFVVVVVLSSSTWFRWWSVRC